MTTTTVTRPATGDVVLAEAIRAGLLTNAGTTGQPCGCGSTPGTCPHLTYTQSRDFAEILHTHGKAAALEQLARWYSAEDLAWVQVEPHLIGIAAQHLRGTNSGSDRMLLFGRLVQVIDDLDCADVASADWGGYYDGPNGLERLVEDLAGRASEIVAEMLTETAPEPAAKQGVAA